MEARNDRMMNENMEHISPALPDQKNYEVSYGLAFKLASQKLLAFVNLEEQCQKSDSIYRNDGKSACIELKYLNRGYRICLPEVSVAFADSAEEVELRDKILIMHYITQAKGTALANSKIAFKELKEGANYYPTYFQRAVKPLVDHFGKTPEKLVELAQEIGGYKTDLGDTAVTIPAFSRVPITLVLWSGDEEFPSEANILFDGTVLDYLAAEDLIILCQTISWKLVKLQQMKKQA